MFKKICSYKIKTTIEQNDRSLFLLYVGQHFQLGMMEFYVGHFNLEFARKF